MSKHAAARSSRRRLLGAIGLGAAAVLAAACSPAASPTSAPAAAKPAGKAAEKPTEKPTAAAAAPAKAGGAATKIRATVWVGQAELDSLGKMTNAYKEKSPGVEVEWINISGGGPYGRDKL